MAGANGNDSITALRGPALTHAGDPFLDGIEHTQRYESDAIVAMRDGRIAEAEAVPA